MYRVKLWRFLWKRESGLHGVATTSYMQFLFGVGVCKVHSPNALLSFFQLLYPDTVVKVKSFKVIKSKKFRKSNYCNWYYYRSLGGEQLPSVRIHWVLGGTFEAKWPCQKLQWYCKSEFIWIFKFLVHVKSILTRLDGQQINH